MTIRQQWSQGLQWGACAWLGYVVVLMGREAASRVHWMLMGEGFFLRDPFWLMAGIWLASLALIIAGSRWARPMVAAGVLGQVLLGLGEAAGRADLPGMSGGLAFRLSFFVPMCVPLLPLIVLRVERPRLVLALLALGRWREVPAQVGGVIPVIVAAGVVAFNRGAQDLLWGGTMATAPWCLFAATAAATVATARWSPRAMAT